MERKERKYFVAATSTCQTVRYPDNNLRQRLLEQRHARQYTSSRRRDQGERAHVERVRLVATPNERRPILVNPSSLVKKRLYESRTNSSSLLGLMITRRRSCGTRWQNARATHTTHATWRSYESRVYLQSSRRAQARNKRARKRTMTNAKGSDGDQRLSSNCGRTRLHGRERDIIGSR